MKFLAMFALLAAFGFAVLYTQIEAPLSHSAATAPAEKPATSSVPATKGEATKAAASKLVRSVNVVAPPVQRLPEWVSMLVAKQLVTPLSEKQFVTMFDEGARFSRSMRTKRLPVPFSVTYQLQKVAKPDANAAFAGSMQLTAPHGKTVSHDIRVKNATDVEVRVGADWVRAVFWVHSFVPHQLLEEATGVILPFESLPAFTEQPQYFDLPDIIEMPEFTGLPEFLKLPEHLKLPEGTELTTPKE
ncbi:MAG: hypothetical protein AAF581_14195 [Planctomycetota bacterium]